MAGRVLCIGGALQQELPDASWVIAQDLLEALAHLQANEFDAILYIVTATNATPETPIEEICRFPAPLVLYAPDAGLAEAVRWTKLGAHQVCNQQHEAVEAINNLTASSQLRRLANQVAHGPAPVWRAILIGQSRKMHNIAEIIRLVAPRRCTVLITGETGSGKEVIARAIHAASNRCHLQMVSVNCSALPENLLEAELFGHTKGAFTGATGNRVGRFEQAQGSTLFLDEIGDMALPLQAKLLRVLQEREFQRLGSSENIRTDVRIVAATNSDLPRKVRQGEFREDLFYRLNVVPIAVPPLRDRPEDIPDLAFHFIERICREERIQRKSASCEVIDRLKQQDWPGNVRQLENAIEMAIVLSADRPLLTPSDFPMPDRPRPALLPAGERPFIPVPDHGLDFERTIGGIELNLLEQALRKTGGNKKMAAEMLRLKRTTLTAKLRSLSEFVSTAAAGTAP